MSQTPRQRLISNRGGGCIEDHQARPLPSGAHVLELRCPEGVIDQLRLVDPRYEIVNDAGLATGRHMLRCSEPAPSPATRALIDLLESVLTLPSPTMVDFAIALDWYKSPADGVSPDQWRNTDVGDLVHRGKYWYSKDPEHADKLREVGTALVGRLGAIVDQHPVLSSTDVVVDVPGHDAMRVSFGSRVANAVARRGSSRFVRCEALVPFRTPAKSLALAQRRALIQDKFICRADLRGLSVLIVDDIYSTGTSVAETARAIRIAGAARVAVLCAVRTMRS